MKTADISGMDKDRKRYGYEWGCQVLMFRALHWLRDRPKDSMLPVFRTYQNITGISTPQNIAAKEMEKFALDHEKIREFGATGAMVQFSMVHALKRFELGEEAYLDKFKDSPGRIFDFDEADAFPVEAKA